MPVRVVPRTPTTLAMPKSMTFTMPWRLSIRFVGLISRCTMPMRWAAPTPSSACLNQGMASSTGKGPRRRMSCSKFSPSTNSIAMKAFPSCTRKA